MKLVRALRLSGSETVAIVGAGGKTTTLFQLARELAHSIVTTTTHLGAWQVEPADRHFRVGTDIEPTIGTGITLITGKLDENSNRYEGLSFEKITQLKNTNHLMPLLIEADGARLKALKAPAAHEPAIPECVDVVVVLAGLSGLGKALDDAYTHRVDIFGTLAGLKPGETITPDSLVRVLSHPDGGLKNIPAGARRVVILNQADTPGLQAAAAQIATPLLEAFEAVIITSLQTQTIHAVHENIAAVILAAGEAHRYGQPKQLLDFHGRNFIRAVTETAITAGMKPVVMVSGAYAEPVEVAVNDLPIKIIRNEDWMAGQSTSIRAGIAALPRNCGGAIFLLADQPQVTGQVIRALVERHAQALDPVIAPYVFDKRANPVLFDRVTFADLLKLEGDVGGRAIFSKFSPRYMNWYDRNLLLDVDTPEDYTRLLESEEKP